MKITLIQPPGEKVTNDRLEPPLGLMYLSAMLKGHEHDVSILDFSGDYKHSFQKADIFGFSTFTPSYSWVLQQKEKIQRHYPDALYVAGGPHVSALPEKCIKDWDHIVVGEGEIGILNIVSGNVDGIIDISPIASLDLIPFPDYSDIDVLTYDGMLNGKPRLSIFTSRGCSYKCAFCNSNVWNNSKVRFRGSLDIVSEINYLKNEFGINDFRFVDDLFAVSELRLRDLLPFISPLNIHYKCNGRVGLFTNKMATMLKESGCTRICFGIESGSDKILYNMNKRQTVQQAKHAIRIAKKAGLEVRIYIIVGFPGETWETIEETKNLIIEEQPMEVLLHTLVPFPGTDVFDNADKYGIINMDIDQNDYVQVDKDQSGQFVFDTKELSRDEMQKMFRYLYEMKKGGVKWVE